MASERNGLLLHALLSFFPHLLLACLLQAPLCADCCCYLHIWVVFEKVCLALSLARDGWGLFISLFGGSLYQQVGGPVKRGFVWMGITASGFFFFATGVRVTIRVSKTDQLA